MTSSRLRAARVFLMSTALIAGYWAGTGWYLSSPRCESTQTNPWACLGEAWLSVVVGLPMLALVVAVVLLGRGLLHALAGGVASVALGTVAVYQLLSATAYGGSDTIGWVLTAPAVGLAAAVWSVRVPDSRA
ncbi:hypothetical protein [Nocardioides mangrovi]|uniref:Uncharacterized protein n=1 Tax=Nocardioides mangrovi TaxID=2874580 RepID=A0ABS7UC36_9ACTN|nr:hypothetical protein [Nocardioides mangrovi]MBZ5738276.1 hypothetical protein [Nocardioides mangrovi]